MEKSMSIRSSYLLAAALVLGASGAAVAQPSRTFVASTGSDTNAGTGCARTAPCRSFGAAIGAVAAGGEVVALDTAGYGPMTINKAVTVTSEAIHAAITASTGVAIEINAPSAAVTVRNLRLVGAGAQVGVNVTSAARVYLDNLIVSGFSLVGLSLASGRAYVHDTVVRNNTIGGIAVGGAGVIATIDGTRMESGGVGLGVVEGATAFVRDCVATGNAQQGLWADSETAATTSTLEVERCLVSRNGTGINAGGTNGGTAVIRVAGTRIVGNTTGVLVDAGGTVSSFGDNKLAGNGTDGTFTGPTIAKQ
jgi:hypothetical protein